MAQIDGDGIKHQGDVANNNPLVEDKLDDFEFIGTNEEDADLMFHENAYLRDLHAMLSREILLTRP
jgi:hypothetical protein